MRTRILILAIALTAPAAAQTVTHDIPYTSSQTADLYTPVWTRPLSGHRIHPRW